MARKRSPSTAEPPTAKKRTSLKYHLHAGQHFMHGMLFWITITARPLETLSVKLMAP